MKLIPVKQAQAKVLNIMADKNALALTVSTFKKDRSLMLRRQESGWELEERGFTNSITPLEAGSSGKRLVKEAFKREFPRSNKLYCAEVRAARR